MELTLTVLRCPPAVAPETRILTGGEFTIGRGPGVDWVLSDVNQMVSRRHCTLVFRAGDWQVVDDSANGTFPNRDEEPIGKGNKRTLRDHDRLRIGPYEIGVHLAEETASRPEPRDSPSDDPFADSLWSTGTGSPDRAFGGPFVSRTQDDHSSALDDAMRPPNPIENLSAHTSGKIPDDDLLPEGWEDDLLAGVPGASPVGPAPAPPLPPVQSRRAPPSPAPPPEPATMLQAATMPEPATISDDTALLGAFLAGAGLPDAKPADPLVTMRRLGETYRALVSGLRSVLIARASIKSEFRIEQTLIQTRGNNPLKFSANDDDAVSALLGVGRHTGMAPDKAVTEALRDIRLHELASMAAMQSAVRALLQSLAPATVRGSGEQGGGMSLLPNQKKARAWDSYEALHDRITQALSDDFDSVFGKAFARAYEEALDDLTARDRP
jgi:type VI secretion system FHA domain protein